MDNSSKTTRLPLKKDLAATQTGSLVVAALMGATSLAGLVFKASLYPSAEQTHAYLANDLISLIIGLPALLGSIWLARRGRLVGLLFWPGALLYVIYNYIAYLVGVPVGWITPVYAVLVGLSAALMFDLLRCIDGNALKARLAGAVRERVSGGILALFGIAFFLLAVGVVSEARENPAGLAMPDAGVAIADMVLSAFLVAGGILLFQRRPSGYVSGLGLLFAATTLFIGVILVVLIRPLLTDAPILWADVIVLAAMGLVCFIPFGLFVRGVLSNETREDR